MQLLLICPEKEKKRSNEASAVLPTPIPNARMVLQELLRQWPQKKSGRMSVATKMLALVCVVNRWRHFLRLRLDWTVPALQTGDRHPSGEAQLEFILFATLCCSQTRIALSFSPPDSLCLPREIVLPERRRLPDDGDAAVRQRNL